jgi:hypothetical protein
MFLITVMPLLTDRSDQSGARANPASLCYFTLSDQCSVVEVEPVECVPHPNRVLEPSRLKSAAKS